MYKNLVIALRLNAEYRQADNALANAASAADAIEELEEKAQALAETLYAYEHPWIPVTERLPQDGQDVLAYLANKYETRIIPANYDHGVWFDCIFARQADQITHWMPTPEPPNEGSQMVTDSNQVQEGEK